MPIATWETKATLDLKDLPSALSICSSFFLKSWTADVGTLISFFHILDEKGENWGELMFWAGTGNELVTETNIIAKIGREDDEVVIDATGKLPIYFPQSWVRACITLDTATGLARIVVDGKVLEDAPHPKLKDLAGKMLTKFTIKLGQGAGINAIFTNVNMFSKPPSLEKLVAMTSPGESECGAEGDFLNWDKAKWTLSDKWGSSHWADWVLVINSSKVEELDWISGPCWRESRMKVYQIDGGHEQSYCMNHCKKISSGRSPSVASQQDWNWLIKEVEAISTQNEQHCHMWLAATEGDSGNTFYHIKLLGPMC